MNFPLVIAATTGTVTFSADLIIPASGTLTVSDGIGGTAQITAGVISSSRGGSVGVVQVNDTVPNASGMAMIGGSGGNAYNRWSDAAGANDTSLYRSGVAELTVGTGANSGSGNLAALLHKTLTALVAAGGGATTPALVANSCGGAGQPTTAAQNGWEKGLDSTGATIWRPVWK